MREMHKLGLSPVYLMQTTTTEEDLVWWSCANLWSWMTKKVEDFDSAENWTLYWDTKFFNLLPDYIRGSYSGSVTMPMLRTNTAKAMEYLMGIYFDKGGK